MPRSPFRAALKARPAAVRQTVATEEAALIRQAAGGNHAAALQLVARFHRFLWKCCIYRSNLCRNADDEDDLYSLAVLALLQAVRAFDASRANFTTFLYWQVQKELERERRHRWRCGHAQFADEEADELPGRELEPTFTDLPAAFFRLPWQTQQALSMRFGLNGEGEHSGREIGRLTGVNYTLVQQRINRGLAALQHALDRDSAA